MNDQYGAIQASLQLSILGKLQHHSPGRFEELIQNGRWHAFDDGRTLWRRGDADSVALIANGYVLIERDDVIVDTVGKGHLIGLSALWDRPHGASVQLADNTAACVCWDLSLHGTKDLFSSSRILLELLKENQRLVHHLNRIQAMQLRKGDSARTAALVAQHLLYIGSQGVWTAAQYPEVALTQSELGRLVGCSDRSIRTAVTVLVNAGLVKQGRARISIMSVDALGAFVTRWIEDVRPGGPP